MNKHKIIIASYDQDKIIYEMNFDLAQPKIKQYYCHSLKHTHKHTHNTYTFR